jgi:hypothetical protein
MRDFKGMKRQRGRNRNGSGPSGGGKPQQNVNRAFDSNGPDNVKIRGHAQHVFEKYQQLARDSFSSGDRVLAENYLQHADHYFRVLRMLQPQRPAAEILGRDVFTSGLDIDFEDEGEGFEESGEAAPEPQDTGSNGFNGSDSRDTRSDRDRSDRDRQDRDRSDRDRSDRDRQERYDSRPDRRDDRFEARGDAPRTQSFEPRREAEGNRDVRRDRPRFEGRPERAPRDGQTRDGQSRDGQARDSQAREFQPRDSQNRDNQAREFQGRDSQNRGEGSSREYRDERPVRGEERSADDRRYGGRNDGERAMSDTARDPLAVIEPESAPLMPAASVEAEASPMLRSQDGGVSEAPAFLQSAVALDESGEVRRPRTRRRRPKALDEGDDAAPAPAVEEA